VHAGQDDSWVLKASYPAMHSDRQAVDPLRLLLETVLNQEVEAEGYSERRRSSFCMLLYPIEQLHLRTEQNWNEHS
jgi:hypothetical protein